VFNIFCLRFLVDCKSLINGFLVLVAVVCFFFFSFSFFLFYFFFFFHFFFIRTENLLKAGPFRIPTVPLRGKLEAHILGSSLHGPN
jgi:hypothetical protein